MEKYTDFEKIGEGSFGSVHRAKDSQTGEIVAIKVFHNAVPEVARSAVREARFLAESCHCNITALKEAYQSSSGRVYLVLEYAHHVLSHQLKSHRKGLPTVAVRSIIFQLLQALHYLHSKGIMHRDCKPANILITNDGMVKLCDFGFARYAAGGAPKDMPDEPLTSYVITRWYRPPEVLAGQPYGCAVDVWAVGCILAEMLTGQPLFPGSSAIEQMYLEHIGLGGLTQEQQVVLQAHDGFAGAQADADKRSAASGTVFTRLAPLMSRSMMAFFRACLAPDPSQRATAKDLLDTPFIKEGAWEVATPSKMPAPAVEASAAPAGGEGKPAGAGRTRPSAAGPPDAAQVRSALRRQASASAIQAGSKGLALQQRQGPTVTQRTARDFALGAESEDDPDDLQRLASTLPPGEALFASGDEAAGDDQVSAADVDQTPPRQSTSQSINGVADGAEPPLDKLLQPLARAARLRPSLSRVKPSEDGAPLLQGCRSMQGARFKALSKSSHALGQGARKALSTWHEPTQQHGPGEPVPGMDSQRGLATATASAQDTGGHGQAHSHVGSDTEAVNAIHHHRRTHDGAGQQVSNDDRASAEPGGESSILGAHSQRTSAIQLSQPSRRQLDPGAPAVSSPRPPLAPRGIPLPTSRPLRADEVARSDQGRSAAPQQTRGNVKFTQPPPAAAATTVAETSQHACSRPTVMQMTAAAITQASASLVEVGPGDWVNLGPRSVGDALHRREDRHAGHACPPPPHAPAAGPPPPPVARGGGATDTPNNQDASAAGARAFKHSISISIPRHGRLVNDPGGHHGVEKQMPPAGGLSISGRLKRMAPQLAAGGQHSGTTTVHRSESGSGPPPALADGAVGRLESGSQDSPSFTQPPRRASISGGSLALAGQLQSLARALSPMAHRSGRKPCLGTATSNVGSLPARGPQDEPQQGAASLAADSGA